MINKAYAKKSAFLVCSRSLLKKHGLAEFLGGVIVHKSVSEGAADACSVLAWGRKPSSVEAEQLSEQLGLPLLRLEDGFIHSLGQGVLGALSCSLIVDKTGVYYDATRASDLELLLAAEEKGALDDVELLQRASTLIGRVTNSYVSKYNNAPLFIDHLNLPVGKKILLVDQTAGDMSLKCGLVGDDAQRILELVLSEQPDATVLIKAHPDVIAGKKKGFFPLPVNHPRVRVVAEQVNPLVLLHEVDHVYVLTSQLGFEALMLGKPVTCFGMPFYAGWGVTDDRVDRSNPVYQRRSRKRSVNEIFAAAYLLYSRYLHPDSGRRCELEAIIDYFSEQNSLFKANKGRLFAFGFSRWKRNYIRRFLYSPGNDLSFGNTASVARNKHFDSSCHIVAWGERAVVEAKKLSDDFNVPVWRIEDGFIRSAGLGSDYAPPLSLVLDKKGIYYDPAQVSDLEHLLQTHEFPPALLLRAETLRKLLLEHQLSKYNVGVSLAKDLIQTKEGQQIVLVPGQVEDDASIRKGCRDIATNEALLREVKKACQNDYIIYKPHPDVVSGNRKGKIPEEVARTCSDLVLDDISITDCLELADEVHTMTSLVGFEGLLRKKKVICYGVPFYSGWGLTIDRHTVDRRTRSLRLDQLVAATLILYPRYINWQTGAFTTPEFTIEALRTQLAAQGGKKKNKVRALARLRDKIMHIYHGVFTFRY
uniref:Capsular polysaccharide export system protein KpsC n=1 Tax=uncultured Thiotrichaceae bacterium TaxID=298394 RepID=A0A6S6U5S0_9GAMM|nr:MAG: Capsular polysaccharide export system protein KpsC [uncultured Thiotrichaceae bacterium]